MQRPQHSQLNTTRSTQHTIAVEHGVEELVVLIIKEAPRARFLVVQAARVQGPAAGSLCQSVESIVVRVGLKRLKRGKKGLKGAKKGLKRAKKGKLKLKSTLFRFGRICSYRVVGSVRSSGILPFLRKSGKVGNQ
jgi:hypothetical protein